MADIIRGNRTNVILTLKVNCVPVTNLADALSIIFVLKADVQCGAGAIVLEKYLADGILVDDPNIGSLTIPFSSTDTTDLEEGIYEMAVQVTWGAGDSIEWRFRENLNIIREIIPQV